MGSMLFPWRLGSEWQGAKKWIFLRGEVQGRVSLCTLECVDQTGLNIQRSVCLCLVNAGITTSARLKKWKFKSLKMNAHLVSFLYFLFIYSSLIQYILTAISPHLPLPQIHWASVSLHKRAGHPWVSTKQGITRCNRTRHKSTYQGGSSVSHIFSCSYLFPLVLLGTTKLG